jgi:hypothetical protein
MKTKYIDIIFSKKHKHSGFHIFPMLILNVSYETLTFALFVFVVEFRINRFRYVCKNCGKICKNKYEANNHCLDEWL